MVEHTALSRRQAVAVVVVVVVAADAVVLVELVAAGVAIAVAAAIGEGAHADVDEDAYVGARADVRAEVSEVSSQCVAGFGIMCSMYLHAWP